MRPILRGAAASQRVEAGGEGPAGPPAEMVFGDWYPALRAERLRKGDTAVAMLLGRACA